MKVKALIVLVFLLIGVIAYITFDRQKLRDRPFIELKIYSKNYSNSGVDLTYEIIDTLLLDYLNSGFVSPLNDHFRIDLVSYLNECSSQKEVADYLRQKFQGVDIIFESNAIFRKGEICVLTVLGGSDHINENYEGEDKCLEKINAIVEGFLDSIIKDGMK